jgi:hypothetical protein
MNIDIQFEESNQSIDVDFGEIQIIGGSVVDATIEPLNVTENGTYTAHGNVDGYSPIRVNVPIPDGYIQPQGTIEITENGEYGVTEYANAIVNVEEAKEEQEKTIDITENGTTEVAPDDGKVLSKVTVNVDVEQGIAPSGTLEITENGEYDVTEYASANVNVEDLLQYATFNGGYAFFGATFPKEKRDIHLKIMGADKIGFTRLFAQSNITSAVIEIENVVSQFTTNYMFAECLSLTEITFIGSLMFYNVSNIFNTCSALKTINGKLDFSKVIVANSITHCFTRCYVLEDVEFVENTIRLSIIFAHCNLLSDKSIQSIIDGLAEVETTQTLTLHADVKAKLTEAQLTQITSKNWTLA